MSTSLEQPLTNMDRVRRRLERLRREPEDEEAELPPLRIGEAKAATDARHKQMAETWMNDVNVHSLEGFQVDRSGLPVLTNKIKAELRKGLPLRQARLEEVM